MGEAADRLILVGRVAGAFGVKGEVRLTAYTADPLALFAYRTLLDRSGQPKLTLVSARAAKGDVICRTEEPFTKEEADALRGTQLFVPRSALPPPEEEEYYHADLIGLVARSEDGEAMGRIKAKRYGLCERCHKPIPKLRLEFMPAARLDVACATPSISRL